VLKARAGGTEEKMKTSPMSILKRQVAEQNRKIADLEEQLAAAETRDGSLFDLRKDRPEDIGLTVASHIGPRRWGEIKQAVDAAFKNKKAAPAG
jgi:hypothetical protein